MCTLGLQLMMIFIVDQSLNYFLNYSINLLCMKWQLPFLKTQRHLKFLVFCNLMVQNQIQFKHIDNNEILGKNIFEKLKWEQTLYSCLKNDSKQLMQIEFLSDDYLMNQPITAALIYVCRFSTTHIVRVFLITWPLGCYYMCVYEKPHLSVWRRAHSPMSQCDIMHVWYLCVTRALMRRANTTKYKQ